MTFVDISAATQLTPSEHSTRRAFLTGATGYVGGRLGGRLLEAGWHVRCLVRSAPKLASRPWSTHSNVEIVEFSGKSPVCLDDLTAAMRDCEVAYYLIHSMAAAGADYARADRELARVFAQAAENAGIKRIIYLGGLGEMGQDLSEHLTSRREVETCLAKGKVPVTVLRAAMIIGSGSASFEILRYLTERLPIMITPKWVQTQCQPIAIRDVLFYLARCLDCPDTIGATLDIGGPDVLTYSQLIRMMASALGLPRRIIIPVPLLTPRLSSLWIHLITPLGFQVARPLADGLKNRVVCRDSRAAELMPSKLLSPAQAIELALGKLQSGQVETAWSDAGVMPGDPEWAGGRVFSDIRKIEILADPTIVFNTICKVGGGHGYYAADWLWRIRGWMDQLAGGPGLRRSRRDPMNLSCGDALDFWRVTAIAPPHHLRLQAEMKLPGQAVLEFDVALQKAAVGNQQPRSILTQTARFRPRGLAGLAYWYAVAPLHNVVFNGMLNGIRDAAQKAARGA